MKFCAIQESSRPTGQPRFMPHPPRRAAPTKGSVLVAGALRPTLFFAPALRRERIHDMVRAELRTVSKTQRHAIRLGLGVEDSLVPGLGVTRDLDPHALDDFLTVGPAHREDELGVALRHKPCAHLLVRDLKRAWRLGVALDPTLQSPSVALKRGCDEASIRHKSWLSQARSVRRAVFGAQA